MTISVMRAIRVGPHIGSCVDIRDLGNGQPLPRRRQLEQLEGGVVETGQIEGAGEAVAREPHGSCRTERHITDKSSSCEHLVSGAVSGEKPCAGLHDNKMTPRSFRERGYNAWSDRQPRSPE